MEHLEVTAGVKQSSVAGDFCEDLTRRDGGRVQSYIHNTINRVTSAWVISLWMGKPAEHWRTLEAPSSRLFVTLSERLCRRDERGWKELRIRNSDFDLHSDSQQVRESVCNHADVKRRSDNTSTSVSTASYDKRPSVTVFQPLNRSTRRIINTHLILKSLTSFSASKTNA